MGIKRFAESCMEGGGVAPSAHGEYVEYADHIASHAYDEAKEREPFAEAMVGLGRCNHVNAVLSDDDFYHFKSDWEVWKACAKSRARSAE